MTNGDERRATPPKNVTIYTDGGSIPNPGRGGYGVVLRFGGHCKELSGGFRLTTNNRMELMAVIVGLEALKEACQVRLHCDSRYIVDAINSGSAKKWQSNDWRMGKSETKLAKNSDLWERLLRAYEKHNVEFVWVKGHAGIADNERCDELAEAALNQNCLLEDAGYVPPTHQDGTPEPAKIKMTKVNQPCRKCQTPVVKETPTKKSIKKNQTHYYAWYLRCPNCRTIYMVKEAMREIGKAGGRLFDDGT